MSNTFSTPSKSFIFFFSSLKILEAILNAFILCVKFKPTTLKISHIILASRFFRFSPCIISKTSSSISCSISSVGLMLNSLYISRPIASPISVLLINVPSISNTNAIFRCSGIMLLKMKNCYKNFLIRFTCLCFWIF